MTETALAKRQTRQAPDIRELLRSEKVKDQIALALPKHMNADRMLRVALTAVNKTPKLLQCNQQSLLSALMTCSQMGIEPDGRNAHMIPYGDQCQLIIDYKGLITLARRNGIQNLAADVVCENDEFEWYRNAAGLQFTHRVDWRKPRGKVYAAYCIWTEGNSILEGDVMQVDEIEKIRKRSRAGTSGPWVTDWNEMAKKTVVRRSSKKWDISPELTEALDKDDDRPDPEKVDAERKRPRWNTAGAQDADIVPPADDTEEQEQPERLPLRNGNESQAVQQDATDDQKPIETPAEKPKRQSRSAILAATVAAQEPATEADSDTRTEEERKIDGLRKLEGLAKGWGLTMLDLVPVLKDRRLMAQSASVESITRLPLRSIETAIQNFESIAAEAKEIKDNRVP